MLSHVHILMVSKSNLKLQVFGLFRVLFALWPLKYPRPKSQQAPRVSTELEMVINLLYSFIPLQKILQKSVNRPVENPQKSAKNIKMTSNTPRTVHAHARNLVCFANDVVPDFTEIIRAIFLWQTVNVTFVLEYLHYDFLRITFEFSVSKTTLRTTKLPSSRVLRLQQAQTKNSYRYGR